MKIILLTTLLFMTAQHVSAQKNIKSIEIEFKVEGVCEMCKERIEEAAIYTKGVKYASWDKNSRIIKLVYNGKKTDEETIHQAIAKAGHDTEKVQAREEDYLKIPDCCRYRDGVETH